MKLEIQYLLLSWNNETKFKIWAVQIFRKDQWAIQSWHNVISSLVWLPIYYLHGTWSCKDAWAIQTLCVLISHHCLSTIQALSFLFCLAPAMSDSNFQLHEALPISLYRCLKKAEKAGDGMHHYQNIFHFQCFRQPIYTLRTGKQKYKV